MNSTKDFSVNKIILTVILKVIYFFNIWSITINDKRVIELTE